jgi:transcription elongation factor GreB
MRLFQPEGKRRLREIDRRIRFLRKRLDVLEIVYYSPQQEGKVFFGAWVELENEDEEIVHYRIVGSDEFDPHKNAISINSPMAKALIGKIVDDDVVVNTPEGKKEWTINSIHYKPID